MPDLTNVVLPGWAWVIAQILLILVVAFLALRFTRGFVHGIFKTLLDREAREGTAQELTSLELRKRMETLDALGANLLQFFIVVIAGLMILGRLGLDIGPAVAGLGIVGIAVGFGAQSLVKDYFNGALILVENQYTKGDVIRIAGVEGTVEDLTLRRTTLRDFDGNVHTVPNSAIIVASNLTRGWARINEELQVPSADLVDQASEIVDRIGREMAADPVWRRRLMEPPHVDRIDALGPTGITLHIAGRVEAAHRWTAIGELRRRLLTAFRQRNLPFVPSGTAGGGPAGTAADTSAAVSGVTSSAAPAGTGPTATSAPSGGDASVVGGSAGLDTTPRAGPAPGQDDLAQGTD
jgi:small-conductance mechanosensitive channel